MRTALLLFLLALPAAAQGNAYNYCQANPNSTLTPASIGYVGSLVLDDQTFGLTVSGLPTHSASFGMFTYGQTPYNVPFGNGYLCVSPFGPGIHRMVPQSLTSSFLTKSSFDSPAEFASFAAGSSWNFQFWYRDPTAGGSFFNLSDALHVDFATVSGP
jgi:hypothetical protein